jgi:hypothetical protein
MTDINNDPFYPGLFSEENKELVRRGPLWPLILPMHYNFDRKLLVISLRTDGAVIMGDIQGLRYCTLKFDGKDYELYVTDNHFTGVDSNNKKAFLASSNLKYMLRKIGDRTKDPGSNIVQGISSLINDEMHYTMITMAQRYAGSIPVRIHRFTLSQKYIELALEVMYGRQLNTLGKEEQRIFAELHENQLHNSVEQQRVVRHASSTFQYPKWIVLQASAAPPNVSRYIVGCGLFKSVGEFAAARLGLENKEIPASLIKQDIDNMSKPFRLYKSLEDVDDKNLMASLTLCKIHREGQPEFGKYNHVDSQQLIPHLNCYVWPDINAMAFTTNYNTAGFICDRIAE